MDIPAMMQQQLGLTVKRTGREWHSPCPQCGGTDRLIIWERGNYYCRQCGIKGWLGDKINPAPIHIETLSERVAREKKIESEHLAAWQAGFQEGYLRGWHDAMDVRQRSWWHSQGMTDEIIDDWQLGYCHNKKIALTNSYTTLGAYTIPILDPHTAKLVNVQFRLENPPEGIGKYRQVSGIPARNFYTSSALDGEVVIVEGAKKALVLYHALEKRIQVVGLPGITPRGALIDELNVFTRKWFIPDPGVAAQQIKRFTDRLQNIKVLRLFAKPDDAVVQYGMTRNDFHHWFKIQRSWA